MGASLSSWFLWIEDDVIPFRVPGSLLRVGGIIAAIQDRYDDAGHPAFVRLGVGMTAALLHCSHVRTHLLQYLKTTDEPIDIDEAIAHIFEGRTLTHETPLFGHDNNLPSTVQDQRSIILKYNRAGNAQGQLQVSTNLVYTSGQGFDLGKCLGYVWTPCPMSGDEDADKGVWSPTPQIMGFRHTPSHQGCRRWLR